jgi:hypothetical protein
MFAAAPLRDEGGTVVAFFAIRLRPAQTFVPLLREGRPRDTGETYAFDAGGRLLSESRFDAELRAAGVLALDQPAMLHLVLRTPSAGRPLTRMAAQATRGEAGTDLDGYSDYRGVPVVGAWSWSRRPRR